MRFRWKPVFQIPQRHGLAGWPGPPLGSVAALPAALPGCGGCWSVGTGVAPLLGLLVPLQKENYTIEHETGAGDVLQTLCLPRRDARPLSQPEYGGRRGTWVAAFPDQATATAGDEADSAEAILRFAGATENPDQPARPGGDRSG